MVVLGHLLESVAAAPEGDTTNRAVDVLLQYFVTLIPHRGFVSLSILMLF